MKSFIYLKSMPAQALDNSLAMCLHQQKLADAEIATSGSFTLPGKGFSGHKVELTVTKVVWCVAPIEDEVIPPNPEHGFPGAIYNHDVVVFYE